MGKKKFNNSKKNVFKVVGAKSLKKTKAKAVKLGLKSIQQQKVQDLDEQLSNINKSKSKQPAPAPKVPPPQKKPQVIVTKEEVAETVEKIDKMDL